MWYIRSQRTNIIFEHTQKKHKNIKQIASILMNHHCSVTEKDSAEQFLPPGRFSMYCMFSIVYNRLSQEKNNKNTQIMKRASEPMHQIWSIWHSRVKIFQCFIISMNKLTLKHTRLWNRRSIQQPINRCIPSYVLIWFVWNVDLWFRSDEWSSYTCKRPQNDSTLVQVSNDLAAASDKGLVSILVLLNLSEAFNTVGDYILLHSLEQSAGIKVLNPLKARLDKHGTHFVPTRKWLMCVNRFILRYIFRTVFVSYES